MDKVTPEQLMNAIVVVLAVFAGIITVDKMVDIVKKWRSPTTDVMGKLANDKARLDEHDKMILYLAESNRVLCEGVLALIDHELHNGNGEQMQKARDDILKHIQASMYRH